MLSHLLECNNFRIISNLPKYTTHVTQHPICNVFWKLNLCLRRWYNNWHILHQPEIVPDGWQAEFVKDFWDFFRNLYQKLQEPNLEATQRPSNWGLFTLKYLKSHPSLFKISLNWSKTFWKSPSLTLMTFDMCGCSGLIRVQINVANIDTKIHIWWKYRYFKSKQPPDFRVERFREVNILQ